MREAAIRSPSSSGVRSAEKIGAGREDSDAVSRGRSRTRESSARRGCGIAVPLDPARASLTVGPISGAAWAVLEELEGETGIGAPSRGSLPTGAVAAMRG